MNRLLLLPLYVMFSLMNTGASAQNIGINGTGSLPNNSAGLDVDFTNKGMLVPRIALTSALDATTITAPATSLLIYNTATAGVSPNNVIPGFYYWSGSVWTRLATTGATGTDWTTTGNAGTNPTTNFIGTTDNQDLVVKSNNNEVIRVKTSGRIGINESNPNSSLHVRTFINADITNPFDGLKLMSPMFAPSYTRGTLLGIDNGSLGGGMGTNAQLWNFENGFLRFGTNDVERLRITENGSFGFNESNPVSTVTMRPYINGATGAAYDGIRILHPTAAPLTTNGLMLGIDDLGIEATLQNNQSGDLNIESRTTAIKFKTNSNERMRILANGTVGIGHTTPHSTLTIQDNVGILPGMMVTSAFFPPTTYGMQFGLNQFVQNNGRIWNYMNGDIEIGTNNTEIIRVISSGEVGIKTASPSYDLDVNGVGNFSNGLRTTGYTFPNGDGTANQVIQTDGSGTLKWVDAGIGTVSFVDMTMPSIFNVSGGPVTNSGTFTVDFTTQTKNTVLAGPAGGAPDIPTFRNLEEADIPTLSGYIQNTSVNNNFAIGQTAGFDITGNAEIGGTLEVSGNVGIGTTSPGAKLEVAGQVKITGGSPGVGKVLTSDATGLATWTTPATASAGWNLTGNTGTTVGTNFIGTNDNVSLSFKTNNTEKMRLTNAGNLGIGTLTPAEKLHISNGNAKIDDGYKLIDGTGNNLIGNDGLNINVGDNASSGMLILKAPSGPGTGILLENGPSTSAFFSNTGNFGVGTFSPTEKLHISNGNAKIDDGYKLIDGTGNNLIGNDGLNINVGDNASSGMLILKAPSGPGNGILLENGPSTSAFFSNTGNFGVGTFSPTEKLEVNGKIKVGAYTLPNVDGTLNQVLKTDGSGTLTWSNDNSGGTGTVTSVALSMPSIFNVSGSPVTTSGTLTSTLANQSANMVFAGPSSGVATTPTFRALVAADIPALTGYIQNTAVGNNFATGQAASFDITGNAEINGTLEVNGVVGIGTTTPVTKLGVIGTANNPSIPGLTSTGVVRVGVSLNEGLDIGKMASIPYSSWMQSGFSGSAEPLSLQPSGGNTGIGTVSPTSTLEVFGSTAMRVRTAQVAGTNQPDINGTMYLYTSGTGNINLPAANTCTNRIYVILNNTGAARTISSYRDLTGAAVTTINNSISLWVVSDGTNWQQIK